MTPKVENQWAELEKEANGYAEHAIDEPYRLIFMQKFASLRDAGKQEKRWTWNQGMVDALREFLIEVTNEDWLADVRARRRAEMGLGDSATG